METSEFLYLLRPRRLDMLTQGMTAKESRIVQEHVDYLEKLATQSVVLLAGRTQTADKETFGLVILTAESEGTAREIMNNDPAVREQVMTAQLFPYKIASLSRDIVSHFENRLRGIS
jgi:uncharacterized protein YciI